MVFQDVEQIPAYIVDKMEPLLLYTLVENTDALEIFRATFTANPFAGSADISSPESFPDKEVYRKYLIKTQRLRIQEGNHQMVDFLSTLRVSVKNILQAGIFREYIVEGTKEQIYSILGRHEVVYMRLDRFFNLEEGV